MPRKTVRKRNHGSRHVTLTLTIFLTVIVLATIIAAVGYLFGATGMLPGPPPTPFIINTPFYVDSWNNNYNVWTPCTNVGMSQEALNNFCDCKGYGPPTNCMFQNGVQRNVYAGDASPSNCMAQGAPMGSGSGLGTVYCGISCGGILNLLSMGQSAPNQQKAVQFSGLGDLCSDKTVYVKKDNCNNPFFACSATAASSCTLTTPGTAGTYTYFACVDKNGDSDFADHGESSQQTLQVTATCGNNIIETDPVTITAEVCDGTDKNGQTCQSQGYTGGTLSCNGQCNGYDTSLCLSGPPPGQVTDLSANAGNAQVGLSWTATSGASCYKVYRSTSSGFSLVSTTLISSSSMTSCVSSDTSSASYTDTGVTNGNMYYYKVTAVNAAGAGTASAQQSATPQAQTQAPGQVTGLSATAGNSQISLSWSTVSGASCYKVYRGTATGFTPSLTALISNTFSGKTMTDCQASDIFATTYKDSSVTNENTYYYKVTAVNSVGAGTASAEQSATPSATPQVPAQVIGLSTTAGNAQVSLSWSTVSGASCYKIFRSTSTGFTPDMSSLASTTATPKVVASCQTGDPVSTSYADSSVTNGNTYYYKVTAVNAAGAGTVSVQQSAMPTGGQQADTTPPTITQTSPSNKSASASTSSTISFTFSEAVNTAQTEAACSISPSTAGTFAWSGGNTILTFTPTSALSSGTTYTVTTGIGAKDVAGNALANAYILVFSTAAGSGLMGNTETIGITATSGQTKAIIFTKTGVLVQKMRARFSGATTADFTVNKLSAKPTGTLTPSGIIYSYLDISTSDPASLADINITFMIDKGWLTTNNIDLTKVKLQHWDDDYGEWSPLAAPKTDEDTSYGYFTAESPGLSTFAISGTGLPVCSGSVNLSLPSKAEPETTVTASVGGLGTDCSNKNVTIRSNNCAGTVACTILLSAGTDCEFDLPATMGKFTYIACIDKNSANGFADAGETATKIVSVESNVQACTDGTPYDECASVAPNYCSGGTLIQKASICGCPSGYDAIGNGCQKSQQPQPTGITEPEARSAIDLANSSIAFAQSQHKDVSNAISFLTDAISAFNSGNFDTAKLKADMAKVSAESAEVAASQGFELGDVTIYIIIAIIAAAGAGGAFWYFKIRKPSAKGIPEAPPPAPSP